MAEKGDSGTGMSYLLRLVQHYQPSGERTFFELEAQFQELERHLPEFPQGKRYQLVSGREPANVLVWECELASLVEVENALKKMADDPTHTVLFEKQKPYILEMSTEIYQLLDL
jgi:hypothetical protein